MQYLFYNEDGNEFKDINIFTERDNFIISTLYNEKNKVNNETIIGLRKCEDELRSYYNISANDDLFIYKHIQKQEGYKVTKIGIEVFLKMSNLARLNTSVCENIPIIYNQPFILDNNIDKYNASSDYYTDNCSYIDGLSLYDRKKIYNENNLSICQANCTFIEYNYVTKIAQCSCTPDDLYINNIFHKYEKVFYKFELNEEDKYKCINNTRAILDNNNVTDNKEILDLIVKYFLQAFSDGEGNDEFIDGLDNTIFQLTTSENQKELLKNKSLNKNNVSIIDLGECEDTLKQKYHINKNDSLIILKSENKSKIKSSEKNIQYELFDPYNLTKLNLSLCKGSNINLYIKMELSEVNKKIYEQMKEKGYDMFNIYDKFYQDICTPYKTENNTDILLSDRVDYIYNNDDTQCQPNCFFTNYSIETEYMVCNCSTQEEFSTTKIEKFTAKKLYQSFYDVLKYSNYDVYKCYKLVFVGKVLTKNIGSIIIYIYFLAYLINFIVFTIKKNEPLKIELKKLNIDINAKTTENKNNTNNIQKINNNKIKSKNQSKLKKMSTKKDIIVSNKKIKDEQKINIIPETTKTTVIKKFKIKKKKKRIHKKSISLLNSKRNLIPQLKPELNNELAIIETNAEKNNNRKNKEKKDVIENNNKKDKEKDKEEKKELDDYEYGDLEYEEAVKLDKRNFFRIYFATIRREHSILFTFFSWNDYNLLYIKIARFIFLLATDIAMNVFFFTDESMHKIFLSYGKYDFVQQIPQIVYSTIVSKLLETFLCFLSMTDKYIYEIKNEKPSTEVIVKILKCINIKLIFFFVSTFLLFAFYWYTVASFCAVYENTSSVFIKDSLSSFALGCIEPFFIYLIPVSLRFLAVRCSKVNLKLVYKLSDIIPLF